MASNNDITTRITTGPRSTVKRKPRKSACLIQFSGDALGRRYYIHGADMVVGRSKTSGIIVQDDSVSRAHAHLIIDGDQMAIEDIGSANGTFVNNRRIRYEGKVLRQTVSMGVSEIQPQFKSGKALLDDANQKLYQSKHGGRNRIVA